MELIRIRKSRLLPNRANYNSINRNRCEIKNGIGIIHLDGSGEGLYAEVNREDLIACIMFGKWYYSKSKNLVEHRSPEKTIKLGRFIASRLEKFYHGWHVRYLDGNGLNCKRNNLYIGNPGRTR